MKVKNKGVKSVSEFTFPFPRFFYGRNFHLESSKYSSHLDVFYKFCSLLNDLVIPSGHAQLISFSDKVFCMLDIIHEVIWIIQYIQCLYSRELYIRI